jgi:hypothetical protein
MMSRVSQKRQERRYTLFPATTQNASSRLTPPVWPDTTKETVNKREQYQPSYPAGSVRGFYREAPYRSVELPDDWELPALQTSPDEIRSMIRRNLQQRVSQISSFRYTAFQKRWEQGAEDGMGCIKRAE